MADRALAGTRVVNTRAAHQAGELTELLEAAGAEVLHYPAITIEPATRTSDLDEGIRALVDGAYDWLVLTSSNTVYVLRERMRALGFEPPALGEVKIATVGSSTAQTVEAELGRNVDLVPDEFVAEALAEALNAESDLHIFLPQSAIARPVLAESLRQAGAEVNVVDAYYTRIGRGGVNLPEELWRGRVDAVTFTSASTVHNFMRRLKRENGSGGMLVDVIVACIGPVTAEAARAHDLPVKVVPQEHTLQGMVEALAAYVESQRS